MRPFVIFASYYIQNPPLELQKEGYIPFQTVGYRAPEVCFGDVDYGDPAESWSLGCVLTELLKGDRFIVATSNEDNQDELCRIFGTAKCEVFRDLPLFRQQNKATERQQNTKCWPPKWPNWSGSRAKHLHKIILGLLEIDPRCRLRVTQALREIKDPSFVVEKKIDQAIGERGLTSVVQCSIDDGLLKWMQTDPAWTDILRGWQLHTSSRGPTCVPEIERKVKMEMGGYVSVHRPTTLTCASQDCSTPCVAASVRAFGHAFRTLNEHWLMQLTSEVRNQLRSFPETQLGQNGQYFFDTCFSQTAFTYSILQVMRADERTDPEHFDGGASVLLAVLTIYGERGVQFYVDDDWLTSALDQCPGDFYVASGSSARHRVHHYAHPGNLFRERGGGGDVGVKIVVMFRSDLFAGNRSRCQATKPAPGAVFDVVNGCVARKIARQPLVVPTMEDVMRAFDECAQHEHAAAAVAAADAVLKDFSYRALSLFLVPRLIFSPSNLSLLPTYPLPHILPILTLPLAAHKLSFAPLCVTIPLALSPPSSCGLFSSSSFLFWHSLYSSSVYSTTNSNSSSSKTFPSTSFFLPTPTRPSLPLHHRQ